MDALILYLRCPICLNCQSFRWLFFCFEQFEVSLEIGTSFTGNITEIYDCEICCNPNKLDYEVYDGEININNVGDGNE